jgi:hypothetical protein
MTVLIESGRGQLGVALVSEAMFGVSTSWEYLCAYW